MYGEDGDGDGLGTAGNGLAGDAEAVDEDSLWRGLRLRRDRTLSAVALPETAGGSRADGWKTPIDSAFDEYFPIWDINVGNSRATKVPHVG